MLEFILPCKNGPKPKSHWIEAEMNYGIFMMGDSLRFIFVTKIKQRPKIVITFYYFFCW